MRCFDASDFLLEDDMAQGRGIAMALRGPEANVICHTTLAQARETLAAAPHFACLFRSPRTGTKIPLTNAGSAAILDTSKRFDVR